MEWDKKWKEWFWYKCGMSRYRGIEFDLSLDDRKYLVSIAEDYPSIGGWQLARLDHSKGYTLDNVEWQTHRENVTESNQRRWRDPSYKYNPYKRNL
tara:strand:+ start:77 stop:364 length:288 start_codon:yes stop_codon:yes gene_type:complete